jgi:hypothetical protein
MSLAFEFAGDAQRAQRFDMETIWAPVERFTIAERYDAASKASPIGIPMETILLDILGFSPQEAERTMAQIEANTARETTQKLAAEAAALGHVQLRIADPAAAPAPAAGGATPPLANTPV